GLVISLGEQHSFPLDSVFAMVRPATLREDLVQAALASPLFTNRWRWNATRSLALLRHEGGRRVPMPLQRMRADDLLAAVFPAQAWPDVRDADELHDALLSMVLVPAAETEAAGWTSFASELVELGRATWASGGMLRWLVPAERVAVARAAMPGIVCALDWPGAEPGREE